MPTRLRFTLHGSKPDGPFAQSQALQGLIYGWIKAVDPADSQELHDNNATKPFAISPLVPTESGTSIFYVSCLDDSLTASICKGADLNGKEVQLKTRSKLLTFDLDPNIVFESTTSWARFERDAVLAHAWGVQLLSPTVCLLNEQLLPLPQPVNYFASWYSHWESFAPKSLKLPEVLDFVRDRVIVTGFSGETIDVPINDKQEVFPGFIGRVDFAVHRPKSQDAKMLKILDRLISLSEYSGTGAQTMRGLGQTRTEQLQQIK